MSSLPDILRWQAEQKPDAVALQSPEESFTYEELATAVSVLAERLSETGFDRVGLCGDNTPGWIIADLACRVAGVVCVPVPGFFSAGQVEHLTREAGLQALLFGSLADLPASAGDASALWGPVCLQRCYLPAPGRPLPRGTSKITFTSGSTGKPRGVCLSAQHQDATVGALARRLDGIGIARHLCVLPLATLLENVAGVYLPLTMGATIHVWPLARLGFTGSSQFDAMRFIQTLHECRPDSLILVPELAAMLVAAAEQGALGQVPFRFVAVGGGKVSPALLQRAADVGLPIYEGYGLSECGSVVALNGPGANRPGCVGRPLTHVDVQISDDHEILVTGNTHLGYLGDPGEPADPLHTGDLGRFTEDGFLVVDGRSKNLLITSFGRNINPEWLESELIQSVGARQAFVFGDGEAHPRALLVVGQDRLPAELREAVGALNATLPDYARLHTIHIRRQPLTAAEGLATPNGRLVRPALLAALETLLAEAGKIDLPDASSPAANPV